MALFGRLFDKREKLDFCRGCDFLFQIALMQKVQFPIDFPDIDENQYRNDIIGIVTAYLDTKPREKGVRTGRTFGEDAIYYGTVHTPSEIKKITLPQYKEKYSHYSKFINTNMGGCLNITNARTLALEVCRVNCIELDATRINSIIIDINVMKELVDATLSTYKFI